MMPETSSPAKPKKDSNKMKETSTPITLYNPLKNHFFFSEKNFGEIFFFWMLRFLTLRRPPSQGKTRNFILVGKSNPLLK
jgi:hypothetical protein